MLRMTIVQTFLSNITVMLGDSLPVLATFAAVFLAIASVSLLADWAGRENATRDTGSPRKTGMP
jgi:hypothetical protein